MTRTALGCGGAGPRLESQDLYGGEVANMASGAPRLADYARQCAAAPHTCPVHDFVPLFNSHTQSLAKTASVPFAMADRFPSIEDIEGGRVATIPRWLRMCSHPRR